MGQFLLVIPEGWTQLDWAYVSNNLPGMGTIAVLDWINANYYLEIEAQLKAAGLIAEEQSVIEAKLIDDTYFLVRLG